MEEILHNHADSPYKEICFTSEEEAKSDQRSNRSMNVLFDEPDKQYKIIVKHIPQSWKYYDSYNKYIQCYQGSSSNPKNKVIDGFISDIVKLAQN